MAFSHDSTRLASASWDKTVKVWDAASGQLMLTLHTPNNSPLTRQRIFEIEDLGDTLKVKPN